MSTTLRQKDREQEEQKELRIERAHPLPCMVMRASVGAVGAKGRWAIVFAGDSRDAETAQY
jgi:hypothetical protein